MSEDISRLPPQVQERLLRLQQLQQTLQTVMAQKQQVEMEQTEVDQSLTELQKTAADAVIYKAIGSLLVKAEKAKVTEELAERKELLTTRSTVLAMKKRGLCLPTKQRRDNDS